MNWFRRAGTSLYLELHVQPGARHNEITGLHGERLKLKIKAPPVDGRANEALIEFLSGLFQCSLTSVTITKGMQGRIKTVCIAQPKQIPTELETLGLRLE